MEHKQPPLFALVVVVMCLNSYLLSTTKLGDIELLLHGLNLEYLADIMNVSRKTETQKTKAVIVKKRKLLLTALFF